MDNKKKEDELLSHNYDGIEEYDNDLPKWWVYLFVVTLVFGFVYVGYYHLGPGLSQEQALVLDLEEVEKAKKRKAEKEARAPKVEVVNLALAVKEPSRISNGKEVYAGKCASCHGMDGGGMIGPNLTDAYWIHGGSIEQIKMTIEKGVLEKGMLAWKGVISDDEIINVVAYIDSLKGTSPANPKAPQGELVSQ